MQGPADVFINMRLPFESLGARLLNREIFETLGNIQHSIDLHLRRGVFHLEQMPVTVPEE